MSLRAERTIKMKNRRLMTIALYKIEKGERKGNSATIDNCVTKIEIEGEHYNVTSLNLWTGKEETYTVPTTDYEIVINKFN